MALPPRGRSPPEVEALALHKRLSVAYGRPMDSFREDDPLSELDSSLLSHRTRSRAKARAFQALQNQQAGHEALSEAATAEVQGLIQRVTWPGTAPRTQAILRVVAERHGGTNIDCPPRRWGRGSRPCPGSAPRGARPRCRLAGSAGRRFRPMATVSASRGGPGSSHPRWRRPSHAATVPPDRDARPACPGDPGPPRVADAEGAAVLPQPRAGLLALPAPRPLPDRLGAS